MASSKVTALTAQTSGGLDWAADLLYTVDVSATAGKKITLTQLFTALQVGAIDTLTAAGLTIGGTTATSITLGSATINTVAAGSLKSTLATGGIGYATGAGGAVTQITSRSTGVTLSKVTGQITTDTTSLAAGAFADFVVTNTTVVATDVIAVSIIPGGTGSPRASVVNVATNAFTIRVTNDHASTADTSADKINFVVLKAVAA